MIGDETAAGESHNHYLSIVLTGRNDEYGIDFRTRFLRTLTFNHRELAARHVPFEIVFVEWAPPRDRPLLIDVARDSIPELGDDAVFRGIVVDRQYQDALSLNPRLEYLEFIAKNVGIRRAAGAFVLTSNCDVLLGRSILEVFSRRALESAVVYRAARYDLKMAVDPSRLDWALLEDSRNLERPPHVLKPPLMGGGTGDFLLLDRTSFHSLGGFNEVYRVARIGVDQNFVVKALSAGLTVRDIGGPVYHMNHVGSYQLTRQAYKGREAEAHYGNIQWPSRRVIYVNPSNWGLAAASEQSLGPQKSALRFSWDAVPPLVDLHRVVLPVSRADGSDPGRFVRW
jgi:hypothetical protein